MTKPFSKSHLELALPLIVFSALFLFYHITQPHISFEAEPLLDAHQYLKSYLFFEGKIARFDVNYPFNTRVAIPFLASLLPFDDILLHFKIIHFGLLFGSVVFFQLSWQSLDVSRLFQAIFWFVYFFHWLGPIRHTMHEPLSTDSAVYFFSSMVVWSLVANKNKLLYALIPLSVVFKETLVPYVAVLVFVAFLLNKNPTKGKQLTAAFFLGLVVLTLLKFVFPEANFQWKHQAVFTLLWYLKYYLLHPFENLRWLCAMFSSMGILLLIFPFEKKHLKSEWFYLMLCGMVLSILSGVDHSRLFFTGIGFFYLFLFTHTSDAKLVLFSTVCLLPFMHLFSVIPNISDSHYTTWFPEYASWETNLLTLSYILGCYLCWKVVAKMSLTLPKWIHKKP